MLLQLAMRTDGGLHWKYWGVQRREGRMVAVRRAFEPFFSANGIEDDKKKDVFLTVILPQTYKLLMSLVAPAKPGEKDYT